MFRRRILWKERQELSRVPENKKTARRAVYYTGYLEATSGFEPLIEVLQTSALTTWPRRRNNGAEDGIRTRDLLLGKEMLYH